MPSTIIKQCKTTSVEGEPWSPPDGDVKIWKVKIETPDGNRDLYSTMSQKIATVGWSGDLELYTNAKGREYIRQAPKEEVQANGSTYTGEGMAWGNALNNAVQLVSQSSKTGDDAYSLARESIEIAKILFAAKPGTAVEAETKQNIENTFGKDTVADVSEDEFSLRDIPF